MKHGQYNIRDPHVILSVLGTRVSRMHDQPHSPAFVIQPI